MDASLAAIGIGPLARLRAVLETLVDPHVLLLAVRDEQGAIVEFEYVDANSAVEKFFGTPVDQVIGTRLLERHGASASDGLFEEYVHVVDTGEDLVQDRRPYELHDGSGRVRSFDVRGRKVGDALSITWHDVTAQSDALDHFELLAENTADALIFTRHGVIQWVSPSFTEQFGWAPDEVVGRHGEMLVHPDDVDIVLRSRAGLGAGRSGRVRLRHLRKDGGVVWCESSGRPVRGDDGEVEGAVIAVRDITDQVEAEEEARRSEARYRLVAEHSSDVVYVADPDGDFAWVSPSVETVLGWRPEDLIGTPVIDLLAEEDRDVRERGRQVVFAEGRRFAPVEVRFLARTGAPLWMSLWSEPVVDAAGTVTAAVCSLRECQREVLERWAATTLSAGNAVLAEATDEATMLDEMCEAGVRNGGYRFVWYGRKVDAPGCPVEPVAMSEAERSYLDGIEVTWDDGPFGQGPAGRAIRTGRPQIVPDMRDDPDYAPWSARAAVHGFRSAMALPVRVNGRVDGAINVYASQPDAFGPRVVQLFEDLTRAMGIGMERLRDRRDLQVAFANSIDLIASVVESRDPYTAGHQARVAELAAAIGVQLGLDDRRIEGLTYAATIHDVGKVGVPIDLLSRPGALSTEELALIKRHALVGWEITNRFEWPWPVADIVHQHHERMDGSGYPQGLSGDDILLEARIVAVADVYEAVSSRRPYRAALGTDTARAMVVEGAGTLYDPDVVAAFERVLDDGFTFEDDRDRT